MRAKDNPIAKWYPLMAPTIAIVGAVGGGLARSWIEYVSSGNIAEATRAGVEGFYYTAPATFIMAYTGLYPATRL